MTYSVAFWNGKERVTRVDLPSVAAAYEAMIGLQLFKVCGKVNNDAFAIYEGDFGRVVATPAKR